MNRVLCYLSGCDCQRRNRDRERLKTLAAKLETLIDLEDFVSVHAERCLGDEDGDAPKLRVSICADWTVDHERTAVEEIVVALDDTAHKLQAAARRLEGGAA